MKTSRRSFQRLAPLVITVIVVMAASMTLALVAPVARASDSGMSGMEGMSAEEMQNMATPAPAPSATMEGMTAEEMQNMATPTPAPGTDGHAVEAAMDPTMDMSGGSANWFIVGGFVLVIAGATLAAVLTKRHLRRRMRAGELAGAGIQDV